jgi:hypothetical protein
VLLGGTVGPVKSYKFATAVASAGVVKANLGASQVQREQTNRDRLFSSVSCFHRIGEVMMSSVLHALMQRELPLLLDPPFKARDRSRKGDRLADAPATSDTYVRSL